MEDERQQSKCLPGIACPALPTYPHCKNSLIKILAFFLFYMFQTLEFGWWSDIYNGVKRENGIGTTKKTMLGVNDAH